ncbi:hypothetical protein GF391_00360 [Candidatus Uhrbacteria bacterium]|nr:hypothetical protein [Candidatus Uhrbacteria bacterium]
MSWSDLLIYSVLVFFGIAVLSFLFSKYSIKVALKYQVLDIPKKARKIQTDAIPLLGGLGIGLSILFGLMLFGFFSEMWVGKISHWQLIGFGLGVLILIIGGAIDDKYDLPAWQSFIFPLLAALTVVLTGTAIVHITNPADAGPLFLNWWHLSAGSFQLSLPGDMFTIAWLLVAIYATKITDGLDGLVSGISIIGAAMVGLLSAMPAFFQPSTTVMSAIVAGSFAGFLPHNRHPAKQYLGEAGSTIAGFCLGFLAVVSSAKLAIALAVLAIPIADIAFVVLRRMLNNRPWFKGDSSHLHFRLLAAGLPHRRAVHLFWLISASAGSAALFLQTRGKLFLVFVLVILTLLISWIADRTIQKRLPKPQSK